MATLRRRRSLITGVDENNVQSELMMKYHILYLVEHVERMIAVRNGVCFGQCVSCSG